MTSPRYFQIVQNIFESIATRIVIATGSVVRALGSTHLESGVYELYYQRNAQKRR